MLKNHLQNIVKANPDYAPITPVIEKEILHHDILDAMVKHGAIQTLTFIGGTSLRLCYNSSRLSEDLDFNGGHNFKPADFNGLDTDIQQYLQNKYETEVVVRKPKEDKQGNTSSWKISVEKEANRPDLLRQKMHIDVCSIPSFAIEKRALINHYNLVLPTEGMLISVQSLKETLADKFIAVAYRGKRIKPRDLWDLVWIKQRGVGLSIELIESKLDARKKTNSDFKEALASQLNKLEKDDKVRQDFTKEMSRFVPMHIKERTIDNPDYWAYLQAEIISLAKPLISLSEPKKPFDMGL